MERFQNSRGLLEHLVHIDLEIRSLFSTCTDVDLISNSIKENFKKVLKCLLYCVRQEDFESAQDYFLSL